MSRRRMAAVIAAVVLAVGLAVGLWPLSVADGVGCGSAFSPHTTSAQARDLVAEVTDGRATNYVAQCSDVLTSQRTVALLLAAVGAAGLIALWLMSVTRGAESASRNPQAHQ